MAGTVEAVGPNVTLFKPGDEVYGGVGAALSEYVVVREKGAIVLKPENMSFEEAAAIPIAAVTALQGLRDNGRIAAGQKVLINGASGARSSITRRTTSPRVTTGTT
jgi:NADPH:quinone reductase-like Zn-dependent oxidoreductase